MPTLTGLCLLPCRSGDTYRHAVFKRLGYLTLDSNERSSFRARELKSVYVDAEASFVRLVVHKPHTNQHNLYSQVGFIAINVVGAPLPPTGAGGRRGADGGALDYPGAGHRVTRPAAVEDLAVDMRMDGPFGRYPTQLP